jgi:XRE family transcriptional regulator, regulator of sulfur utilization
VTPSETFGSNLRRERQRAGLSQEALAQASGMHMTEISRLERAVRDPRLSTIVRVARALNVAPSHLLADID